jgi:serine/threonine protein kinase
MDNIRIDARITKGAQGIIYRCSVKDNPTHEFAIKRITVDDLNEVNRYLSSHFRAKEMKHQNIAECYKVFLDQNEAFPERQRLNIFMPYYKDGDLDYLIRKKTNSFKKKLPQQASSNQYL